MNLDEIIKERRSTRSFSTEKVGKKLIEKLIEAARFAPSAGNRQPWNFVVLEGSIKNKVAEIMEKQISGINIKLDRNEDATHPYNPTSSVITSIKIIKQAPVFILVFRNRSDDWLQGDYLSIGCAVEHMCLKATELGLGTLWVRDVVYTRDKIADFVGYKNMELVTGLAVGYSNEYPYERHKKSIEEIVEYKK